MVDSVERDVIYRIRLEGSEANAKTLREAFEQVKKAREDTDKAAEASMKKRIDEAKKTAIAEIKEAKRVELEKKKSIKAEEDAKKKAAADDEKRLQRARQLRQQASAKMAESNAKMRDSVNTGTEGILKLGRGFAMLGLVGEKSNKKILEGLIKVQATFDILRGGIEVWRALSMGAEAYRLSLQGVAAAQAAVGATGAGSAAVGGTAGAAGAIGGVGGRLAVGGAGTTLAVGAGVLGGSAFILNSLYEAASGKGAEEGSMIDWLVRNVYVPTEGSAKYWGFDEPYLGKPYRGAFESQQKLERMQSQSGLAGIMAQRRQSDELTRFGGRFAMEDMRRQLGARQPGADFDSAQGRISAQRRNIQAEIDRIQGGEHRTGPSIQALQEQLTKLASEDLAIAEGRLEKEREIRDERVRGAREALALTKQDIASREAQLEAEKNAKRSVLERFGRMTPEQQARTLEVFDRARAQGVQTRAEAEILSAAPGLAAQRMAREFFERSGREAGGARIAIDESRAIRETQRGIATMEAKVEVQTKTLQVEITNRDEILATLTDKVSESMDVLVEALKVSFENETQRALAENTRRMEEAKAAARNN